MQTNFLFYVIYAVMAVIANLFLPGSTLLGIAVVSALTVFVPIALVGHNQKQLRSVRQNWASSLGCSLILGVLYAVLYAAKVYMFTIALSITGSPYNVPAVDFERIFLLILVTTTIANTCVFFAYDGFKHMKRQRTQAKSITDTTTAVLDTKPDASTQSDA